MHEHEARVVGAERTVEGGVAEDGVRGRQTKEAMMGAVGDEQAGPGVELRGARGEVGLDGVEGWEGVLDRVVEAVGLDGCVWGFKDGGG